MDDEDFVPPPPTVVAPSPRLSASPKSSLHSPTANSLHQQKKKVEISTEDIPIFKNDLEGVESRLFNPTLNSSGSIYHKKDDEFIPNIPDIVPISCSSHLLTTTTASELGSKSYDTMDEVVPVSVKPIAADSNLLKPTQSNLNSAWTDEGTSSYEPVEISPISSTSHLLMSTSAMKASAWGSRDEADGLSSLSTNQQHVQVPISSNSSLLRTTASIKLSAWSPKEEDNVLAPSVSKLDPSSNLLRGTKSTESARWTNKSEAEAEVKPHGELRSVASVSSRLTMPTAALKNSYREKKVIVPAPDAETVWNSARIRQSPLDLPLVHVVTDISNIESRFHEPTANTINSAYKPKDRGEGNIHQVPFSVGNTRRTPPPASSLREQQASGYEGVPSRLMQPTAASQLNAVRKLDPRTSQSPSVSPSRELIAPGSNLLRPTRAASGGHWSPKSVEKVSGPSTQLASTSHLLKSTAAVQASNWLPKPVERVSPSVTPLDPLSSLLKPTKTGIEMQWDTGIETRNLESRGEVVTTSLGNLDLDPISNDLEPEDVDTTI